MPRVSISAQARATLTPQHQVIGVFTPDISRISPPLDCTISPTRLATIAAPRQVLPAAAESKPNREATAWLSQVILADQSASTIPHTIRPRRFIVGLWLPLN